jgi:hypothetical protein
MLSKSFGFESITLEPLITEVALFKLEQQSEKLAMLSEKADSLK